MPKKIEKYHFIGIGGIGMSALARILLDNNFLVSGSDLGENENTRQLLQKGAVIRHGHSAKHISHNDIVVYSSGIKKSNPEFQAALAMKCPIMHRSELLLHLMRGYQTVAITGTHGKTTTSSLFTAVMIEAGLDPSFALGGKVLGLNGKSGKGNYFIAEADESDGSFLNYHPDAAIITNLEAEHLDHYKTKKALQNAFKTFFNQVNNPHLLFYCGDDAELICCAHDKGVSYGFNPQNALHLTNYRQKGWTSFFDIHFEGKKYTDIECALIGEHNALNAAAVFGLSLKFGISEDKIRQAFKNFPGIARRLEKRAEVQEILFLDDYAHHPTEIVATLKAVKKAVKERRLVVLFQPHRYTRTRDHLLDFAKAFEISDLVYITDIYSSSEEPIEGIDAQKVIASIQQHSTVPVEYLPSDRCIEVLQAQLRPHDVFLTMGAGDVTHLHNRLTEAFQPKKYVVGLLFGGLSCEHEISLRSSRFVANSLNQHLYDVRYFGIDKKGKWVVGQEAKTILFEKPAVDSAQSHSILDPTVTQELERCDLFLPILHGTYGEDGTIQGFFEMLAKPYIGPDYRAAAISMDKVLTKRLVESRGVKTPKDVAFGHLRWVEEKKAVLDEILTSLAFPLYVKPVHLGSSVGINCVSNQEQLERAIDEAFRHDFYVMVEEGKMGCRELEFAVIGNSHSFSVMVPPPGEKLAEGKFVDYERKYGSNAVQTTVYPEMEPHLLEKGKKMAKSAYEAVGCSGMTRVDFLLDSEGEFWFFELNPIPGLQEFSLFPKIWKRENMPPDRLVDQLIILALHRKRQQDRHFTQNA